MTVDVYYRLTDQEKKWMRQTGRSSFTFTVLGAGQPPDICWGDNAAGHWNPGGSWVY